MADFTLIANASSENGQLFFNFTGSGSTTNIKRGDRVRFKNSASSSINVAFQGVTTTFFTTNASPTLTPGTISPYYTIKSTAAFSTFILSARAGTRQLNTTFRVIDNADITPTSFTLGSPQTELERNYDVHLPSILITGINTAITVTGSNVIFSLNGTSNWQPQLSNVNNNTYIFLRGRTSPNYNTTVTASVTAGNLTRSTTLKTKYSPAPPTPIPFHRTQLPVSLDQIISFFGGEPFNGATIARNLLAYNKGGLYVPPISENNRVKTSPPLALSDYLGSYTQLFFKTFPQSRTDLVDTTGASGSYWMTWGAGVAWTMGYSPNMGFNAEYYISLVETTGAGFTTGVNTSLSPLNTWSGNNLNISVGAWCPANTERTYSGRVTVRARHKQYQGYETEASFNYTIAFYHTN